MVLSCILLLLAFLATADGAFVEGGHFCLTNKCTASIEYALSNIKRRYHISLTGGEKKIDEISSSCLFMLKDKKHPYLAIITETDACDSDERVNETYQTIREALGSNNQDGVDLISIRVRSIDNDSKSDSEEAIMHQERITNLASRIMSLKEEILTKSASSKSKSFCCHQ